MSGSPDELRDVFVRLAEIPSPSGEERAVADAVKELIADLGLVVEEDDTGEATGCSAGNLTVRIPGRAGLTPIAFCAHLDTIPVSVGPHVIVENGVVRSDGHSILGADDKAAVAVLLLLARDLADQEKAGPVELLFTVGEEVGLRGANAFDVGTLAAEVVFVLDSEGAPGTAVASAPWLRSVTAEFRGAAAHAGIEPEHGRSAVVAAAHAIAAMPLGRIDDETTANVGLIQGGAAVNVVPERCIVRAEARSRDLTKLGAQVEAMVDASTQAAGIAGVDLVIDVHEDFRGYVLDPGGRPLRLLAAAAADAGLEARFIGGGGGSDSNVFNARGLPAVTLGVGFEHVHSGRERIRLDRLGQLYDLVQALVRAATAPAA